MDRTGKPQGRLAWVAASMLAASLVGCSQMKAYRSGEPGGVVGTARPAVDPYLAHHKVGPPPRAPETLVAQAEPTSPGTSFRSSSHPTASSDALPGGAVPTELVSLGAPVSVPTASRPRPAAPAPAPTPEVQVAGLREPEPIAEAAAPQETTRSVIARARVAVDAMTTYQMQLNCQERVGDVLQPAEDVQVSIRKAPRAVRLEWLAGSHKGREVIYSASEPGSLLHVHAGDSPIPVPPLTFPVDSPMVMKNARHPITEAGLDSIVATLEKAINAPVPGASISYRGVETPASVGKPCHAIERQTPAGETWLVYLDAATGLPALVQGSAKGGELLERYRFSDVKADPPALASADAFDPAKRWGSGPGGLLGRLAKATAGDAKTAATASPR